MRVAGQAPPSTTGRLVFEPKTKRQHKGDDTFEERLAIAKQLEVRRFAPEIDGDSAVFSRRLNHCAHVPPPGHQVLSAEETQWGKALQSQDHRKGLRALPLKAMECDNFRSIKL
jgi:hypothetical protein